MGCGKSLHLLGVAFNYSEIGQKTKLYTTSMDNRFGTGVIASRIGVSKEAEVFNKDTVFSVESLDDDVACVLVDEGQFLNNRQVNELLKIAALGDVPVIVYGLRTDFQGNGFEGSMALGVLADKVESLVTVCDCGKKASFNMRVDGDGKRVNEGEQVLIGDANYVAKCPVCFLS